MRTGTGIYLVDLDERRLVRTPVTLRNGECSLTWAFDIDGMWLPLVALEVCEVGSFMRATLHIDRHDQPLRTSPVRWIRQTTTTARDD